MGVDNKMVAKKRKSPAGAKRGKRPANPYKKKEIITD
jgi:hypothetical protein